MPRADVSDLLPRAIVKPAIKEWVGDGLAELVAGWHGGRTYKIPRHELAARAVVVRVDRINDVPHKAVIAAEILAA